MDANQKDQNLVNSQVSQGMGSVTPGGKEAGPATVVPDNNSGNIVDINKYVERAPEHAPVQIPQAVADAGVKQSEPLVISADAQAAGAIPHNPSISKLSGNITYLIDPNHVERIADGDPTLGITGIAKVEERQIDRQEVLSKAA